MALVELVLHRFMRIFVLLLLVEDASTCVPRYGRLENVHVCREIILFVRSLSPFVFSLFDVVLVWSFSVISVRFIFLDLDT